MPDFDERDLDETGYLYIECTMPDDPQTIGKIMGEAFGRLMEFTQDTGVVPTGPPMSLYWMGAMETFRVALPVPGEAEDRAEGGVAFDTAPAGRALHTVHVGPYRELPKTYRALTARAEADGLKIGAPIRELYVDDPGETPEDQLRTEIFAPVG